MFRYGFLWRFLLTLLVVGFLVAGGFGLYRLGWAQGYQAGAVVSQGNSSGQPPQLPYYGYPPYAYGFGFPYFFFPFGPLLGIGFFLLFFFLIGGLFRLGGWRRWRGDGGRGPRSDQDEGNGPVPTDR